MTAPSPAGPKPRIARADTYHRPPVASHLLKLDANEGARPPSDLAQILLERGPELLRRYPDVSALEGALAARLDVGADRVYVTAGADDAIERCCRAYLGPQSELLLSDPSFYLFARCARLTGSPVRKVPWLRGRFPRQEFLAQLTDRTAVIAIVSPNNPTGGVATLHDVESIASAAPHALVVLDHAYVEYADDDLTLAVQHIPNVVVLRTLSKAWGLAGCRVGYAVGHPDLIDPMRAAGQPYSVAAPSSALALAQLERGEASVAAHVAQVKSERDRVTQRATNLGFDPLPSQANFVLVACGSRAQFVHRALTILGVVVRDYPDEADLQPFLRITMPGNEKDLETLLRALEVCGNPDGLLIELDMILRGSANSVLARLSNRRPIYGLTTRPLDEVERELTHSGARGLLTAMVTLERPTAATSIPDSDAHLSARALRDAMVRLRISRGWVISDNHSTLRLAAAAGALPLGVLSSSPSTAVSQVQPEAAAVVPALRDVEGMLP